MTYVQKSWMRQYWIEREKQSKQKESLPLFNFVCVPSFINKNTFGTSVLLKTIYISKYHNSILWYDSVCSQPLNHCKYSQNEKLELDIFLSLKNYCDRLWVFVLHKSNM